MKPGTWWRVLGVFNTFMLGHWAGVVTAAWLVRRDAFPDVGAPDWRWVVNGAIFLTGAVCAFSVARDAQKPKEVFVDA